MNRNIAMANGMGMVSALQPLLLPAHGGTLSLKKQWADSLLRRTNFVKREATKEEKTLPLDFEMVTAEYVTRVNKAAVA